MTPKNFPKDRIPLSGKLPPLVLTKQSIKNAIELTFEKLRKRLWSKTNAKSYLNYFCVKHSIIDIIIDRSHNASMLDIVMSVDESNKTTSPTNEKIFLEEDQKMNPHLYKNIPLSCIMETSMDDINTYPDSPMHLLSGYVKATMHLMFLVLKETSKTKDFFEYLEKERLIKRIDEMKVSWLPIIEYKTDGFTGFKCSNYLTLGKLLKAHAMILIKLQSRGTDHVSSGKKFNIKEKDANDFLPSTSMTKIMLVVRMLISVYNSLSYLMFRKIDKHHVIMTSYSIKRSLNDINNVDRLVQKSPNKTIWYVKYNLLCLLNCPEDMMRYGPVSDRWEGSMEGEKCIQNVKKIFMDFETVI